MSLVVAKQDFFLWAFLAKEVLELKTAIWTDVYLENQSLIDQSFVERVLVMAVVASILYSTLYVSLSSYVEEMYGQLSNHTF